MTPPVSANISADVLTLNRTITTRFVGPASLISLKTPQEGFQKQAAQLVEVREGYKQRGRKVYRMKMEQQDVFLSGIASYAIFGGHGSG